MLTARTVTVKKDLWIQSLAAAVMFNLSEWSWCFIKGSCNSSSRSALIGLKQEDSNKWQQQQWCEKMWFLFSMKWNRHQVWWSWGWRNLELKWLEQMNHCYCKSFNASFNSVVIQLHCDEANKNWMDLSSLNDTDIFTWLYTFLHSLAHTPRQEFIKRSFWPTVASCGWFVSL